MHQSPYRAGRKSEEVLCEQIGKQLKAVEIDPAQWEWASLIVLIPKMLTLFNLVCTTGALTSPLYQTSIYPLPRKDDSIDTLGGAQVFTKLYTLLEYWQVLIKHEDEGKTIFTSHLGITLQSGFDIILYGLRWRIYLVYIDDEVILSKNSSQHGNNIDEDLALLCQTAVARKLAEYYFFQKKN